MFKKIAGVLVSVAPIASFAAVPTEVTTAITGAGTDAATVAGSVLIAVIGLLGFAFMRRAAK